MHETMPLGERLLGLVDTESLALFFGVWGARLSVGSKVTDCFDVSLFPVT